MEKIVVTSEQEKAFKEFVNGWKAKTQNEIFEIFILDKKSMPYMTDVFKPLNEISDQDFFFMLHGWYEVEKPKFEVGDWVYDTDLKLYRKVTDIKGLGIEFLYIEAANSLPYFEKVTEEWKIVLLELGREKPEFKKGDKIVTIFYDHLTCEKDGSNIFEKTFMNNKVEYFYPIESRVEFKQ